MSHQQEEEASLMTFRGRVIVDEVCETVDKGSSFVRAPESRGCDPGIVQGRAEQEFDIIVPESAV